MPDHIDLLQDRQLAEQEAAMAAARQPRAAGLDACEHCGEPINPVRQALGARLCLFHQERAEAAARIGGRGAR